MLSTVFVDGVLLLLVRVSFLERSKELWWIILVKKKKKECVKCDCIVLSELKLKPDSHFFNF